MIDNLSWLVRGLYATSTLLAAGFALLNCCTMSNPQISTTLRRLCGYSAAFGLVLSVAWTLALAAEIGGEWPALLELYNYQVIRSSPAAELILWRSLALLGLLASSVYAGTPSCFGAVAAILACFSFTRYGHSLSDPALVRSLLLTIHLSIVAWWFAVVPTLLQLCMQKPRAVLELGERFAHQAKYMVALALLCGFALAGLQLASMQWQLQSTYALALLLKLLVVVAILCIAALNAFKFFRVDQRLDRAITSKIAALLTLDLVLFVAVILLSAWLTGPAANV